MKINFSKLNHLEKTLKNDEQPLSLEILRKMIVVVLNERGPLEPYTTGYKLALTTLTDLGIIEDNSKAEPQLLKS